MKIGKRTVRHTFYRVATPWGHFGAEFSRGRLKRLVFPGRLPEAPFLNRQEGAAGRALVRSLRAYLAGKSARFRIPLDLTEGTAFQRSIWRRIARIPHGRTITYAELARAVGSPRAARAAGAACGCNPVPIVIPCHRVVGARGKLGGFSASGGIRLKKRLLALEGCVL